MVVRRETGPMHMIYELMYIVPSSYSETELDGILKKVSAIIEKAGAKLEKTENLGKIKFAYPIKKMRHGTYVLNFLEAEGDEILKVLDRELKYTDEVLRHILIKRPEGIPVKVSKITSYVEPITPEGKRAAKVKERNVQKPVVQSEEKMSVVELDKKLDEILDTDITENI